uniref:Putative ovule protein n=1 Tax=Solanum chacoense TaxID=4108 RepID=A0A0V0HDU5_SOLCH
MFVFNINGKELHFGLRKFTIVTGFECGGLIGFDHDSNTTSKLLSCYFSNASDKVLKFEFIRVFKEDGLIVEDDLFNMSMIYFISTFILSSPPKYSHISKDHF